MMCVPSAPEPDTDTPENPAATDAATDTPSSLAVSLADTATESDTFKVDADTYDCTLMAATLLATEAPTASDPPVMANASDAPMALASSVVVSSAATDTRVICAPVPTFKTEFATDASTAPSALLLASATPTDRARPCDVPDRLAPAAVAFSVDVFVALTERLSAPRTLASICVRPSTCARVTARVVFDALEPAAASATPLYAMPTAPATTTVSSVWIVSAVTLMAPRFDTCVLDSVARAPASCVMVFSATDAPMASEPPAAVKATLATTTVALIVPLMSASMVSALAPLPLMREPFITAVADELITLRASAPPPASEMPPRPTPTAIDAATDTVWMLALLSAFTVMAGALTKFTPSTLANAALPTSFCASDAATDKDAVAPSDTATEIATAAIVLSMRATSIATTDTLAAFQACAWFWSVMRAVMPVLILLTARAPAPAPDTARLAPSTMGGA